MASPARKPRRTSTAVIRKKDTRLLDKISDHLKRVCGSAVKAEVADGFVTLRGLVRTYRQKEHLHRYVMRMHGVRALKDLVRVAPVETIADRKIALFVRQALDAHAELPHGTATVHVRGGVATLKGNVRTAEERFIAEHVASHCRGVIKVLNELVVDPLDEISDEATARAVHGALDYCEDFEVKGITISCADGVVCLRGEVPTLMDRNLAEELARMQAGVRAVENHIQIRPPAASSSGLKKITAST